MTKKRTAALQGRRWQFQERSFKHIWLLLPLGVVGLVVALALTHQKQGLIEKFSVTTVGSSLPPQHTGVALPGTHIPELIKREHIPEGQRVAYNSNPPTSGSHYAVPAQWGIYNESPVDERLVHNLEHGGIIISYNPERIKSQELDQIEAQARELSTINPRVIVTPRANLDAPLALTAWGYLQKLDSYNSAVVKAFYDAHIARGPECERGQCPS